LNVRRKPTRDADIIEVVNQGDILDVVQTLGIGWTIVTTKGGNKGFVMTEFTEEC
jgi:uncharacterized protein YgiM (DUF1202 family)